MNDSGASSQNTVGTGKTAGNGASAPLPVDARRLLVVMPTWLGDSVMATPVLRAIRQDRPETTIVAALRPGLAPIFAGAPWVDETITIAPRGFGGTWKAAGTLRRVRADAALLLPNSFRSALMLRLAGTRRRLGFRRDGRGLLLTHAAPGERAARPLSTVDDYATLGAYVLGREVNDRTLELAVTPDERQAAEAMLANVPRPFVVMNPGANKVAKRWPADRFAAVARALLADGAGVTVTGSPAERPLVREVVSGAPDACDLTAAGVDLGSLKGVLSLASALITNDTGPRHIAAALGTPTIVLFGPTDHRWTTLPGVREACLLADPFLPESQVADDYPDRCRMDRIPATDVVLAARRWLIAVPPADP